MAWLATAELSKNPTGCPKKKGFFDFSNIDDMVSISLDNK